MFQLPDHDIELSYTTLDVDKIRRLMRSQYEAWRYWHTWKKNKNGSEPPDGPTMSICFSELSIDDLLHPTFQELVKTRKRSHITISVSCSIDRLPSVLRKEFDVYGVEWSQPSLASILNVVCPHENEHTRQAVCSCPSHNHVLVYTDRFMYWSVHGDKEPITVKVPSRKRNISYDETDETDKPNEIKRPCFSTTNMLLPHINNKSELLVDTPLNHATISPKGGIGTMGTYYLDGHTDRTQFDKIRPSVTTFDIVDRIVAYSPFSVQIGLHEWQGTKNSIGHYTWISDGIPLVAMLYTEFTIFVQHRSQSHHVLIYGRLLPPSLRHELVSASTIDQEYLTHRHNGHNTMYTRPHGIYFMVNKTNYETANGHLIDQPCFHTTNTDLLIRTSCSSSIMSSFLKNTPYPKKFPIINTQSHFLNNGQLKLTPQDPIQITHIYSKDDNLQMLTIESNATIQLRIPLYLLRHEGEYYHVDTPITLPPGPTYTFSIAGTHTPTWIDLSSKSPNAPFTETIIPRWTFSQFTLNRGHTQIDFSWAKNLCHGFVLELEDCATPEDLIAVCISLDTNVKKLEPRVLTLGHSPKIYYSFATPKDSDDPFPYTSTTPIPFQDGCNLSRIAQAHLYIGSMRKMKVKIAVLCANVLCVKDNTCGNRLVHSFGTSTHICQ